MEKNHVLNQSPSLFDALGTEAFASEYVQAAEAQMDPFPRG